MKEGKKDVEDKREKKVEASEVKVEAGRRDWEREVRPWKVTASSIQVMGSSAAKLERRKGKREDRKERGEGKIGCSTREKERERTVCSLDRIIAGGSGLTSSRITSTSPRTLLVLFVALCFAVLDFCLILRLLLLYASRYIANDCV